MKKLFLVTAVFYAITIFSAFIGGGLSPAHKLIEKRFHSFLLSIFIAAVWGMVINLCAGQRGALAQNIGINTTGAAPTTPSMLEILQPSATASSNGLYVSHTGAVAGSTGYALQALKSGASLNNIAAYISATGATNNYALVVPSGGGYVGIGTITPSVPLDVTSTSTVGIRYIKTGAADARITVGDPTQNWSWATGWATGGDFSLIEEGTSGNRIYVQRTTGNVGIGTSNPVYKLDVDAPANGWKARFAGTDGYILIGPANAGWAHIYTDRPNFIFDKPVWSIGNAFSSYNTGDLYLQTNGTTRIFARNTDGFVGIGNTAPVAKFHVTGGGQILGTNGTSSNTRTLTILEDGDAQTNFGSYPGAWTSALQIQDNTTSRYIWLSPLDNASGANARLLSYNTGLDFYTGANAYAATIASNGNVGINNTAPGYKFTVTGGAIGGNYGMLPNYAAWSAYGTGDGGAAIYNDNGTYQTLMLVGNNSAGGVRRVSVWDYLTVNGNSTITGLAGAGTRMIQANASGVLAPLAGGTTSQVLLGDGTWGSVPAGSGNYIQNQYAGAQASANYWIDGEARVGSWFRNNASGTGLYNQTTGAGIYSPSGGLMSTYNGSNFRIEGTTLIGNQGSSSSYGALTVMGTKNGWSGINFKDASSTNYKTLMIHPSYSGIYNAADNNWDWYFNDRNAQISFIYDMDNNGYYLDPNSSSQVSTIYANNWFRAQGQTGLYFQDYGGGWFMQDASWIRNYNSKPLYIYGDGTTAAWFDNGRVTIKTGSPNPNSSLDVNGISYFGDCAGLCPNYRINMGWYSGLNPVIEPQNDWYGYVGAWNAWYGVYAYNWWTASRRELKRNITPVEDDLSEYVMNDIDKMKPSFYKFNKETDVLEDGDITKFRPNFHLGVILDESPDYIQDNAFRAIDIYSLATLGIAGIKHNRNEIKEIKNFLGMGKETTVSDFGVMEMTGASTSVRFSDDFRNKISSGNNIPVITVTPSNANASLYITEVSSDGFIVNNGTINQSPVTFNWIAMAKVMSMVYSENPESIRISPDILNQLKVPESIKSRANENFLNSRSTTAGGK